MAENPVGIDLSRSQQALMSSDNDSNNQEQSRPAEKGESPLVGWARDLLVSLAISAFIIVFLYQPVKVEGTSMLPGLADQERIFINKFVYRFESIGRGDIVVFRYPRDPSKSYIKRVVGVAGDRIEIDDGRVYLNGTPLDESYVPENFDDFRSYPETVVPPHHFFVLGDHRNLSNDSRDFGPVDEKYIYGKATFVYWPLDKMGSLR
jgi:signal peptidase I